MSIGTILGEKYFDQILFSSSISDKERKFLALCLNFSNDVVKKAFEVPIETFQGTNYFLNETQTFYRFWTLISTFLLFTQLNISGVAKTTFYVSIATLSGKCFSKICTFSITFANWARQFSHLSWKTFQCCQITFYLSIDTLWGKNLHQKQPKVSVKTAHWA